MWKATLLVAVVLIGIGALVRGFGRLQRVRGVWRLGGAKVVRRSNDVPMRVLLTGHPGFSGLHPSKVNRTKGDLVLTEDSFVVASNRGTLAFLTPREGKRFTSVRCTGPMRLVIEGAVPRPDGKDGLYRFEMVIDSAAEWAKALAPFIDADADAAQFTSFPAA